MFFKRNGNRRRRGSEPQAALPPRCARLVRESWWLLVVAGFVYLALILATYTRSDPGWSYSGTGAPLGNRGGVVGAWLSDLLLYLFGWSAWWCVAGGVVLVVAGYRRVVHPEHRGEHPRALGAIGFALVLLSSAALETLGMLRLPFELPLAAGGARGDLVGGTLSRAAGYNGAALLLLVLFAIGTSLLFGVSWLRVMEGIGAALEHVVQRLRRRREEAADRRIGVERAAERETLVEHLREETAQREPTLVVAPAANAPKSERVIRERQRPLFTDMPDSPLPPLALLEDAPPATEAVAAETLEFTSRLIERKLADFGVEIGRASCRERV